MNRFMINLHSLGSTQRLDTYTQGTGLSALNFGKPATALQESFLGNIGEDLDLGHGDTSEDSEGYIEV